MSKKLQELESGSEKYEQVYGQNLLNLYMGSTIYGAIARRLKSLHETRRLDLYFAGSLLYTFILTTVVFALQYRGLSKLDSAAFQPAGTLLPFIGYSFGAITHFQLSPIVPVSGWAQFLTYVEVFSGILIVVLLAFIIFTSARERFRSDIESVVRELDCASTSLESLIQADYELTVRAAEHRLLQLNEIAARYLLRLRHGAELAKEIESEARSDAT